MATGQRTSYTDTGIRRQVFSELISLIEFTEAPLFKRLGHEKEKSLKIENWPNRKYEWIKDTLSPQTGLVDTAGIDNSATTLPVKDGTFFKVGHVIQLAAEYMWVSAVSGNNLTVTRAFNGTTAVAHLEDVVVYIRSIAKLEGADYTLGHTTTMNLEYNYTQILEQSLKVSRTQNRISDIGVEDTMAYHLSKLIGGGQIGSRGKAGELVKKLGNMAYFGKRAEGSATTPRTSGGLDTYITVNLKGTTTTELTKPLIHETVRQLVELGASPNLLVCSAWAVEKVTAMYEGMIRTTNSETTGGHEITIIKTPFGELEVLWDYMCPAGTAYVLDSDTVGWVTFDPFDLVDLPSLGDYELKMVVGEFGFIVQNGLEHAKITHSTTL